MTGITTTSSVLVATLVLLALVSNCHAACVNTTTLRDCVTFLRHAHKEHRSHLENVGCASVPNLAKEQCDTFKTLFNSDSAVVKDGLKDHRYIPAICTALLKKAHTNKAIKYYDDLQCVHELATKKRICLVFHGSGVRLNNEWLTADRRDSTPAKDFVNYASKITAYWGKTHKYLKDLCDPVFVHINSGSTESTPTHLRTWDDPNLVNDACRAISDFKPNVVVGHSMAGPYIMKGIYEKIPGCTLIHDRNKGGGVPLVLLQSPFVGSTMGKWVDSVCSKPDSIIEKVTRAFASSDVCYEKGGRPVYVSLSHEYVSRQNEGTASSRGVPSLLQFNCSIATAESDFPAKQQCVTMMSLAERYVRFSMCGDTADQMPVDVNIKKDWKKLHLFFAGAVTGDVLELGVTENQFKRPGALTDGLVDVDSCKIPGVTYGNTPTSDNYMLHGNHADGTCRYGESTDGASTGKPCSYIRFAAARAMGDDISSLPEPVLLAEEEEVESNENERDDKPAALRSNAARNQLQPTDV